MITSSRRSFLTGLGAALVAAPALVKASNLMPISAAKLWTPQTSVVGAIKPVVGSIPAGWVECDGRWLIARDYPMLYALLKGKHEPDDFSGKFFLPDMKLQAVFDRRAGKVVGRYAIYAGDERIQHKASVDELVASMRLKPVSAHIEDLEKII